ncbi:hybrid signal transduction histidine kinase L-like [Dermacentor albipictus]|uniref:hybrid signal transduction histidine kinase L-like n=1 Tax=Dermacentor albipictus TaxID=60249 RepID=UPI0031FDBF28
MMLTVTSFHVVVVVVVFAGPLEAGKWVGWTAASSTSLGGQAASLFPRRSTSPIARTQVRRMLQGPPAVHQQQLRLWCRVLQLLLGQVALHSNRLPSSSHPSSRPPSQLHESRKHPPHRQSKQQDLEGAVHMATAEYVRQGQSAEARAQEEARFRRQMLEQNQRHHEAHMDILRQQHTVHMEVLRQQHAVHMEGLQQLREVVGSMRDVQQQRLAVERRSQETHQRILQLLLAALAHGGSQVPPPSQDPHM